MCWKVRCSLARSPRAGSVIFLSPSSSVAALLSLSIPNMWRHVGLVCALVGVPTTTSAATSSATGSWHMSPVKVVQARVQGDAPVWHPDVKLWLSKYGNTVPLAYQSGLDTVNTASVEGALMYVQAEGINVNEQSVKCHRKNDMQYVVFYEMTIAQPAASIKYYENHIPPEYGTFVAMDGAKCTNAGTDLPESCKLYYGLDGQMDIGPNVGCNPQGTDPRAPYPYSNWFSYPHSCAQAYRAEKTAECRAKFGGGLCPLGVQPDGETCTYSYRILGYINIDDLVGITKLGYANYQQFCERGGVEFKARNTGNGFVVEQCLPFWNDPGNPEANAKRAAQMVQMYNQLTRNGTSTNNMIPLPSPASLTASNPPCYKNSAMCASAQFGCRRTLYSQLCSVCSDPSSDCVKAPAGYTFPNLSLPPAKVHSFAGLAGATASRAYKTKCKDNESLEPPNFSVFHLI
ncbi:hypothetical protein PsorP6_001509 [Peronosclerospora sorghi]|uniref:Uncharacterized protein n=1 Tax=Peronosclerospora sorghi TaxID=230839 RepID=A0ACC0WRJ2_9STRA|nr:hypothetical protein PsorP6_001509 [Peronosclerospora sorghi]